MLLKPCSQRSHTGSRDTPLALGLLLPYHTRGAFFYIFGLSFTSYLKRSQLLLRLEKYGPRMNYTKGITEKVERTHKHPKCLRPLPLNVPNEIQLSPVIRLCVTLLDANHCAGAVMFLIQDESKAILYTGDIRAEPWWVNSLVRNPVMIPFVTGLKRLDKIYLDTTFASKIRHHRQFPSKQDGITELITKMRDYPKETRFHFHAWTFGYEEVWIALSEEFNSRVCQLFFQVGLTVLTITQIHVDRYKVRITAAPLPGMSGWRNAWKRSGARPEPIRQSP